MPARPAGHPAPESLRAFGLGQLDDTAAAAVMTHLEDCADCRRTLAVLSGDDFARRVRAAHAPEATPAPSPALSETVDLRPAPVHPLGAPPLRDLPPELATGTQYEVLRELGRGGMGVVYLARNRLMDRLEVLKVVGRGLLDRPEVTARFLREIRAAARLHHPNVVTAYTALQQGEMLALAMEYVEGEDLAEVVKWHGRLPISNACDYARQAALGLEHALEMQMVHRDIKPQNLILCRAGGRHVVKILDFGLAKVMREKLTASELTGTGDMLGTPDFIAPEQTLDAARADIRADVYSLGCTLYFLLSGGPPFPAGSLFEVLKAHQSKKPAPRNVARPEVPAALAAVVARMMAKDPAQRYQRPAEVAEALAPFVITPLDPLEPAGGGGEGHETLVRSRGHRETLPQGDLPRGSTPRGRAARRAVVLGAAAGALLMAALAGLWAAVVFRVKTEDGVLLLDVNEPDAEVYVDGAKVSVAWADGGRRAEVHVKGGTHQVSVTKDGFTAHGEEVTLASGTRRSLTARLDKTPTAGPAVKRRPIRAWKNRSGEWRIDDGELVQQSLVTDCRLAFGDFAWTDYDFSCEVKKVSGVAKVGLLYRLTGAGGGEFDRDLAVLQPDVWHKLRVHLRGPRCECYIDDRLAFRNDQTAHARGAVGLRTELATARFRNLRVTAPDGDVLFAGMPPLPAESGQWPPASEPASVHELHCLKGHGAPVIGLSFSPDGRRLVSCSDGGCGHVTPGDKVYYFVDPPSTIRLWGPEKGVQIACSPILDPVWDNRGFRAVAFAPSGAHVFSAHDLDSYGRAKNFQLWSLANDRLHCSSHFHAQAPGVVHLGFTPDGRKARAVGAAGAFWECDVKDGLVGRRLAGDLQNVTCAALSPGGRRALLARRAEPFAEIDLEVNGKEVRSWKGAPGVVTALAFSPDGRRVLSGGEDGTVRLWGAGSGQYLRILTRQRPAVRTVAFSPDGRRALFGRDDGAVCLWDVDGAKELACFTGHTAAVYTVAYSPDGRRVASGGADYTVRLWRAPE